MKKNNKWLMFLILLISAITVGVSQLKIAAVMQDVAAALGVSTTQAALLMSVFTIAGIVLAIPGAAIQDKMGPKNLLLLLMACLAAGNVLGAVSGSFAVVVVSRIIEGISYAMIIMVGVTMINTWFADGGASTATGIFNTFAAVANFIAMNASIPIMKTMGLKSLWWVGAGLSALCLVLVAMFIQAPRAASEGGDNSKATIGEAMANLRVDVLSLAMFCIAFVLFGFITCYPQLFQGYYGLTAETANFYSSLNGLFGIPFCILCGVLVEKTGKPFVIAIIGAVGTALLCYTMPYLGPSTYIVHVLVSAICPGGLVMTSIFCLAPMLSKRPALIGYSMSIINMLYYIGVFASTPVIVGAASSSWKSASLIMTAAAAGAVVLLFVVASMGTKEASSTVK